MEWTLKTTSSYAVQLSPDAYNPFLLFFSMPVTQEIVFIEKSLDLYIYEESKRICLIGDQPSSLHHTWVQKGPHGYEPELWDDARIVLSRDRMLPISPLEHMCAFICHGSVFLVLRQEFPRCGLTPALHTTCPSTHSTSAEGTMTQTAHR